MTKVIKVGQENMTGKRDSKKVLLKLLLTRAKNDYQSKMITICHFRSESTKII